MTLKSFQKWAERELPGQFLYDEPLSKHTSFRIGGPADVFVFPGSVAAVGEIVRKAREYAIPVTVIGNGSNLLVKDHGVRGIVLKINANLRKIECKDSLITAQAGAALIAVANKAAAEGLTGMEFAGGIPGTIGGAVYMNAGAYDGEMAGIVASVTVLDRDGIQQKVTAGELKFTYRHSLLQENGAVALGVSVKLKPGEPAAIAAKMADFNLRRKTKQPLEIPNAGSTFRRPPGYYAGTLIEQTGLKGLTVGGAQVSEKHAGFIVNVGGATAADVLHLIEEVQKRVFAAAGVSLEPEVRIIGE